MYDHTRQPAVVFINHIHVMTRTDGVSLAMIMTPPTSTIELLQRDDQAKSKWGLW
jgi:hypothetical protein